MVILSEPATGPKLYMLSCYGKDKTFQESMMVCFPFLMHFIYNLQNEEGAHKSRNKLY